MFSVLVEESGLTFPFILMTFLGAFIALEVSVMLLEKAPTLLVAYFTLILEDSPAAIGSLGQVGTVHPQDPFAFVITKGEFPVLVKINSLYPSALCSIVP